MSRLRRVNDSSSSSSSSSEDAFVLETPSVISTRVKRRRVITCDTSSSDNDNETLTQVQQHVLRPRETDSTFETDTRVEVYWTDEKKWFTGDVIGSNEHQIRVHYHIDDEKHWHNVSETQIRRVN